MTQAGPGIIRYAAHGCRVFPIFLPTKGSFKENELSKQQKEERRKEQK